MENNLEQSKEKSETITQDLVKARKKRIFGWVILVSALVVSAVGAAVLMFTRQPEDSNQQNVPGNGNLNSQIIDSVPSLNQIKSLEASGVKKFVTEEEFLKYLAKSFSLQTTYGEMMVEPMAVESSPAVRKDVGSALNNQDVGDTGRISETNVQVKGIDEPDIVKTDGKFVYFSKERPYITFEKEVMPSTRMGIMPPIIPEPIGNTDILSVLPITEIKKIAKIDKQGELLVYKNTLIIFAEQTIFGFNINDRNKPVEAWKIKLEDNSLLKTARLYNGKLYLVSRNNINQTKPCPYVGLKANNLEISIPCGDIYYPVMPVAGPVTYNAFVVDPEKGEVNNKVSFVASGQEESVVYMSENSLYITYAYAADSLALLLGFIKEQGSDLFPKELVTKLEKLMALEISGAAKNTEVNEILSNYLNSLNKDERLKLSQETNNRLMKYMSIHKRDLSFTGIAKVSLDNFALEATGRVPGRLLNQFALDEYLGNLRVATTVGEQNFWFYGFSAMNNQDSANDVLVLDGSLKQMGAVMDLGKTERIYSARFIKDRGYLVTFRQIDPFYILDLSDPKQPKMTGELKIPGFSSYLHPLANGRILGVGQDSGKVKLSLFDVSNAKEPKEIDTYLLAEYWSEVSNNHRAFLEDAKFNVFFLPAGQNGYVFSYTNDKLNLAKAISANQAKRAIYINDYLLIVSIDKLQVYNEKDWVKVSELDL